MKGRVDTAKSFRDKLSYCLEDKLTPTGDVIYKDRAEILHFNRCFGDKEELIGQFDEIKRLDQNMSKPVMHISMSLPPGEQLPKGTLVELAADCAKAFDFENHQYVVILHKDTPQQHIHLVVNRIGFDRHTVDDSFSHGKIADFSRAAELRHHLRQELGPRRYQTKEQRLQPRQGIRLDRLRQEIRTALAFSDDYGQFQRRLQEKGYKIYKGRGIAFMDEKHVIIRGYEVSYPLKTIEAQLAKNLRLRQEQARQVLEKEQQQKKLSHHLKI